MALNNIYDLEVPIITSGSQFNTNYKPRILFSSTVDVSLYYGIDTSAYITKWNTLSTRSLNDINDPSTFNLSFDNKLTYTDANRVNNNSIYHKFYKEDMESNLDDSARLITEKIKLTKEDIRDFNFSNKIYLNTSEIGSGYFRVNSILYKPGDFSEVKLIKLNYIDTTYDVSISATNIIRTILSTSEIVTRGVRTNVSDIKGTLYYNITGYLGQLDTSVYNITGYLGELDTSIYNITGYLGGLDASVYNITGYLGELDTSIYNITNDLNILDTSFYNITGYLGELDTSIYNITGNLDQLDTSVFTITGYLGELDTSVYTITGYLGQLDTSVYTITGYLGELDASIEEIPELYYTKVNLDNGQLDNRYYTETELDSSFELYYTKVNLDNGQLDNRYYTETELNNGQLDTRYFTESEVTTWRNSVSQTEMGYLDGVTGDVQTQITARAIIGSNPANNRLCTWSNATTIQGESGLTFAANVLTIAGGSWGKLETTGGPLYLNFNNANDINLGNGVLFVDHSADRVGINDLSPSYSFDVNGTGRFTGNTFLDANIGTTNYSSETTGWRGTYAGAFDFRSIFTDELIAKSFIADIDLALLSGTMISKSITQLSRNFVVPANGNTAYLYVEAIPGFPTSQVFESGDWVRLQVIDRTGGGLTWLRVYGTVTTFVDQGDGEQRWTFTTQYDGLGNAAAGETVYKGAAAQDLGTSGDGFIQSEAGSRLLSTPYIQTATWTTNPYDSGNITVRTRMGNLSGITNQSGFGLVTRKDNDNYVSQWWTADNDWGIRGVVGGSEVFTLGDTNVIAGWTMASDAIHTGTKSLGDGWNTDMDGITLANDGAIHAPNFYVNTGGEIGLREVEQITFKVVDIGAIKIEGIEIWEDDANGAWPIHINRWGYHGGTTQPRYVVFFNGQGDEVMEVGGWTGTDMGVHITGDLTTDVNNASGFAAFFQNDGNNSNRWGIKIQNGADNPNGTDNYPLRMYDGNGSLMGSIFWNNSTIGFRLGSDITLKENIKEYNIDGLGIIEQMQYHSFNWKRDQDKLEVHGWIADEVELLYPEMVSVDPETKLKMIDESRLIPIMMSAIKELNKKVNNQEIFIKDLDERLKIVEQRGFIT